MVLRFKGSDSKPSKAKVVLKGPVKGAKRSDHVCPTCHGTGKDHGHTCETCHGTGHVDH